MDGRELLKLWAIPFALRGGLMLVPRAHVPELIHLIVSNKCVFLGYEGFAVSDQSVQPNMHCIGDWGSGSVPSAVELNRQILEAPPEVTHFEFVFSNDA
jgi:hypothetical protein